MTLDQLTTLAAGTVTATQRSLPPPLRPLAAAVPVHYEALPHADLLAEGALITAVEAEDPLAEVRAALTHHQRPGRSGKVLLLS